VIDRVGHVYEQPALCLVLHRRVDSLERTWWRVLFLETGSMMSLEEDYLEGLTMKGECT